MTSRFQPGISQSETWLMPLDPSIYDRRPWTEEERWAIFVSSTRHGTAKEAISARKILARFNQPLADIYHLRHQGRNPEGLAETQLLMHREMHRRGKGFWEWSPLEWMETLCPTVALFEVKHSKGHCAHMAIMDAAYLLGGVSDLRPVGLSFHAVPAADTYFGKGLVMSQCEKVLQILIGRGYKDSREGRKGLRHCLCLLFVLNRSPYLEDISEALLANVARDTDRIRWICHRIRKVLEQFNMLPPRPKESLAVVPSFDSSGMAPEWYAWCQAWYDRAVDLTPRIRQGYMFLLLVIGRWLQLHFPEVCTPEQWTEDLALHFRSDLCAWTTGQYASPWGRQVLESQGKLNDPLGAGGIAHYLVALRRFFTDLMKRPHSTHGERAHKITLDFLPQETLAAPAHIKRAQESIAPRDIDLRVWARLAIAAATLSESDLPTGVRYPLSFYRALGLVWVTAARRPNEIARLRLECLRQDWDPTMLNEDGLPVERWGPLDLDQEHTQAEPTENSAQIFYLHIPSGKNRGPFWIWIPGYVAEAITAWKRERPPHQREILDRKDREEVDYLFCYRDTRVGPTFLNAALIPVLCAKAGVDMQDAKGRITGHRGRSTRLTLLRRNGVNLEDLAEYAGHADSRTIRRYARQDPLQLHRIIRDADDVSRVIEGVVDVLAAAQGLPALRWFIGYDADGEPQYCANQVYHTCPHRLDCPKCGMFIGGEKARLLHEGVNTLPITSKVPMTPVEKCEVHGDQTGAQAYRAALQQVPTPETPDIRLIFNPEGLSNHELEKLAQLGTRDALDKLQQALAAHEKRLDEAQQHKTGRSALVGAQKKRLALIQQLISDCERCMGSLQDDLGLQIQ